MRRYIFVGMLLLCGIVYFFLRYGNPLSEAVQETIISTEQQLAEDTGKNTELTEAEEPVAEPGSPVEEGTTVTLGPVDESYFDDAIIIGDSRAVGLYEYAQMDNVEFYVSSGMNIYKIFEDPDHKLSDGRWPQNLSITLSQKQYGKIYLFLGINEMGIGDVDYFIENYGTMLEQIRQLQPNAIIFIQGIMRVTTERSEKGDYITNEGIDERNRRLAEFADNQTIFFLDVNDLFCDETGALNPDYTHDGVHLYAQYIDLWKQYLLDHGVNIK